VTAVIQICCYILCSTGGRVCALAAVGSSQIICTTELPLDQLCRSDKMDLFQLPGLSVCLSLYLCLCLFAGFKQKTAKLGTL